MCYGLCAMLAASLESRMFGGVIDKYKVLLILASFCIFPSPVKCVVSQSLELYAKVSSDGEDAVENPRLYQVMASCHWGSSS